jgi:amidase
LLGRIAEVDPKLHSYITVCGEIALEQACTADREIAQGLYRSPLHGIPVGMKDLIFTRAIRTTCGSKILADFIPEDDATVVTRLRNSGAVLVGKHSMTEFAGIAYHSSIAPPVNPWRQERWPGASSSGSAVAVAAGLCYAAIGTDTGGSLRFPAAACGVVGFKPTYGRVSRYGVYPLAETLDHVGPICRTVEDAWIVLKAISGCDPKDATTWMCKDALADHSRTETSNIRMAIDERFCTIALQPEVSAALLTAATRMEEIGALRIPIKVRGLEDATAIWSTIYCGDTVAAHETMYATQAKEYNPAFRSGLEGAFKITAAAYAKATVKRASVTRAIDHLLEKADVLLWPAMGKTASAFEELAPGGVIPPETADYLLRYTAPASISGHPALVLCCGFDKDGMPIAMQLIARHGREDLLFTIGRSYQQVTDWHKRVPPVQQLYQAR